MNWRLTPACKPDFRETYLLAFTETWLGDTDRNKDLHISGFGYPVRMDRSPFITNSPEAEYASTLMRGTVTLSWSGRKCVPLSCYPFHFAQQSVSSDVSFCVDTNIPCKNITVFPYNKPWVTKELKNVINKKKSIFYKGNSQEKENTKEVRNEIRKAKRMYQDKVEYKYSSGDLRAA